MVVVKPSLKLAMKLVPKPSYKEMKNIGGTFKDVVNEGRSNSSRGSSNASGNYQYSFLITCRQRGHGVDCQYNWPVGLDIPLSSCLKLP